MHGILRDDGEHLFRDALCESGPSRPVGSPWLGVALHL